MLYPLKFRPRYLEKMWGGRKLDSVLGKSLSSTAFIGESWELYDFPPGVTGGAGDHWVSSVVAEGPLAGRTLHELLVEHGRAIHGDVPLLGQRKQFPILIKFLDARENLSLQVHPDQAYAARHPETCLKTEAWYVVQADPGATLYKGLVNGTTRQQFADAIAAGNAERMVKAVPVKAGQCLYLPSGTVHALGAGILAAEVQTPSDTTFRVSDYNRIDPANGKPRKLHIEEALECIDFDHEEPPQPRSHVAGAFTTVTRLVTCPYFTLEKVRFSEGIEQPIPYEQPVVWMMLEGAAEVKVEGMRQPTTVRQGDTLLLPAEMKNPMLKTLGDCAWLEVTFPTAKK
jgi:mannose-6-phosphate isomerase